LIVVVVYHYNCTIGLFGHPLSVNKLINMADITDWSSLGELDAEFVEVSIPTKHAS
jgi:hypothetical protein